MIRWQGSEYDFDIDKAGTAELREIKRKYGLSLRKLLEGMQEMDVDAVTCLYWLVMTSDGKHDDLVLGDDLEFPVVEFMSAWAESESQEEAEPDPTRDGSLPDTATLPSNGSSTKTLAKSGTSTSPASRASTASSHGTPTG